MADLAVDQLMIGAYGTVAIETMAKGVPVVCRIRDDLRPFYPADLPIITAEPFSDARRSGSTPRQPYLHGAGKPASHPETWPDLGRRGVDYVRHEHEMHVVAQRVVDLYDLDLAYWSYSCVQGVLLT